MIFIVLFALGGMTFFWLSMRGDSLDVVEYFFGIFFTVVLGAGGLFFGGLSACAIGASLPSDYVFKEEVKLVALQDAGSREGQFFLELEEEKSKSGPEYYYTFFYQEEDGVKLNKVSVNSAIICEEKRDGAAVRKYLKEFKAEACWAIGVPNGERYEIFIPEGSILHDFKFGSE